MKLREFYNPIQARKKRYYKICELINLNLEQKILDVGCGSGNSFEIFNKENEIVGLDVYPEQKIFQNNFRYIMGDGANMSFFKDKEFDLVVCIGVLEHIFPFKKLETMAKEIKRVGKSYVVVVPHLFTIIEPHYQMPFWQFYPDNFKSFLKKHFSLGWYPKNPEGKFIGLNYFKKRKWLSLLSGSSIISYRLFGFGLFWDYIIFKK